jgi:RHS repeat-associated protein
MFFTVVVNSRFTTPALVREPKNTQFAGVRSATSGHRYYSPSLGRFVSRDPLEEQGGLNLYAFCGNNGVNRWDVLGMYTEEERANLDAYYKSRYDNPHDAGSFGFGLATSDSLMFGHDDGSMDNTLLMQRAADYAYAYNAKHPLDGNNAPAKALPAGYTTVAAGTNGKTVSVAIKDASGNVVATYVLNQDTDQWGNVAPNSTPGQDPDIGPDGVRYVGPMLSPDRGRAASDALLLGNTVTGVNGTLVYGASKATRDIVAKEILEHINGRIGTVGVVLAFATIIHEGPTVLNSLDLGFAGASLIPTPWTEVPAAIWTVGRVTYDLTHLPPPPEPQTYRPPPDPNAPSPRYR